MSIQQYGCESSVDSAGSQKQRQDDVENILEEQMQSAGGPGQRNQELPVDSQQCGCQSSEGTSGLPMFLDNLENSCTEYECTGWVIEMSSVGVAVNEW